jgi:hypothetical protein
VDAYLNSLPGETRRLAHAEWGLTLEPDAAGGWPLDVGLRIADELLRAQAFCAPADPDVDLGQILHWNRQTRIVRFACARNGDVWIHGDVPVKGLDESMLDRLLGLLAEGALALRAYAAGLRAESSGASGSAWGA